jgi:hypothetical protein
MKRRHGVYAVAAVVLAGVALSALSSNRLEPWLWTFVAATGLGLLLWWKPTRSGDLAAAPLEIQARAALSGDCSVSILRAEGARFLIVQGRGYAQVSRLGRGVSSSSASKVPGVPAGILPFRRVLDS